MTMMIGIGFGGILGAITRFLLGQWVDTWLSSRFPWGTWIINVSGSSFLGWLAAFHQQHLINDLQWDIWGIGFLGAYTTFSTFSYEAVYMLKHHELGRSLLYVLSSVLVSLFSAWIGYLQG